MPTWPCVTIEWKTLSRPRLASLLWPHSTSRDATGNLRQRLHRLALAAGRPVAEGITDLRLAANTWHDVTPEHVCSERGQQCLHQDLLDTLVPRSSANASRARWST